MLAHAEAGEADGGTDVMAVTIRSFYFLEPNHIDIIVAYRRVTGWTRFRLRFEGPSHAQSHGGGEKTGDRKVRPWRLHLRASPRSIVPRATCGKTGGAGRGYRSFRT